MKRTISRTSFRLTLLGGAVMVSALLGCVRSSGSAQTGQTGPASESIANVPAGAVDPAVDRFRVPLGNAPVQGRGDALVTIIEYSDFQCPFCSRVVPTIQQLQKEYGDKLRFSFKHNPLPFHQNAMGAAQAAVAAQKQGKFFPMYELLFRNQQALAKEDLEKYAKQIGLDLNKFHADYDSAETKAKIKADMDEAASMGARGTPFSFINGRPFSGAQPVDHFKKIVDEEVAAASKATAAGVKRTQIYDALTKNGKTSVPNEPRPQPQPPPLDTTVWKATLPSHVPIRGNQDAEVTIVEWSDFQCPFCGRVEPTIDAVRKKYGEKLRIAWRHNPLPFHENAMPAAKAAVAAGEQGKFWEMHDLLFKNQQKLDAASLKAYATELGLNMAKFEATMASDKTAKLIDQDSKDAAALGARGTPAFFINGRNLKGAQPQEQFEKVIDLGIKDADAALARGVKKSNLYAELVKDGKTPPPPPEPDKTIYKAPIGDAPVKGPREAKVTIVEWSDFQCPFCGRVEPTVDEVMKAYPNDVRVAFKQLPLPFHDKAHLAAEASLAAKAQGKFWEMHSLLFKNQNALAREDLEKYAKQLGLDLAKFKAALDGGSYKQKVDAELAEGNKIGARGTPSFFVNGHSFVGAQPLPAFKAQIDAAIKEADDLMAKKHLKVTQVYDALMKDAKESAAPPAPPPGQPQPPAEDKTVTKVDPGKGPSKGPGSAPIQIVEFSDFQCPFCSRVEPTITELVKRYPGKIRITWRNYPLPFHPNATPAAEAAMAAAEQGKFWEMHDKLFANQQSLDRPSFERFAQELGLDMNRFRSALDSGAGKNKIKEDQDYANSLPGGGMGTPTFYINGRKVSGAQPIEAFASIVDEELKKKGK